MLKDMDTLTGLSWISLLMYWTGQDEIKIYKLNSRCKRRLKMLC